MSSGRITSQRGNPRTDVGREGLSLSGRRLGCDAPGDKRARGFWEMALPVLLVAASVAILALCLLTVMSATNRPNLTDTVTHTRNLTR